MPPGQVRDIGVRLADALAAAHASGILHRDIKPANILVNRFGMVGLSDFGLASIISAHGDQTASREALTPAYSSPETFRGEQPSVLADVYSLAATLYALLSGFPPHFTPGEKAPGFATIMRLRDEPVQDVPGTPPELMALLRAAMSPDPAVRPQSAAALRDALADPGGRIPVEPAQGGLAPAQRTGPPASDGGQTTSARHRQNSGGRTRGRRSARHAGLAAGLVVIIAAAVLIGARFLGHGAGPSSSAGHGGGPGTASSPAAADAAQSGTGSTASVYGIATTSAGCPAAAVRAAVARCPAEPECFNGLVVIAGSATAAPLPCDQPHYWQTFAIAILPAAVQTYDQTVVAADPAVRKVCSQAVMLASRRGRALRLPAVDWEIQVLPPSESAFSSGARAYRCVVTEIGHQPSVPQFGR
jgi:Protein kinase domain